MDGYIDHVAIYAKQLNDEWQKELQSNFKLELEKEIYKKMEYTPIFSTLYSYGTSTQQFKKSDLVPTKIIYNDKTTVCYFKDGSKEMVHCAEDEQFVKEVGVMSCIMKKLFDSRNDFKRLVNSGYVQPQKVEKKD